MSLSHECEVASSCSFYVEPIGVAGKIAPKETVDNLFDMYCEGSMPEEMRRKYGHSIVNGMLEEPQEEKHQVVIELSTAS